MPPYDWGGTLAFFRARAIEGVEEVASTWYRRTIALDGRIGTVEVRDDPATHSLAVAVLLPGSGVEDVMTLARRAFDTESDPRVIRRHLSQDPSLAPLLATRPGLRVPGCWDRFELAIRAILGQQISVVAARRLAGRLVALCGTPTPAIAGESLLTHAFPTPRQVLDADLDRIGMPAARRRALRSVAKAAIADRGLFQASASIEQTVRRLRGIDGIGEWTAQYIAMRASREPDAFPATDVGLLRGAAAVIGARPTPGELLDRAERWRPWRAYAAQHLWASDAAIGKNARRVAD